jgi:hypothetical protein
MRLPHVVPLRARDLHRLEAGLLVELRRHLRLEGLGQAGRGEGDEGQQNAGNRQMPVSHVPCYRPVISFSGKLFLTSPVKAVVTQKGWVM